MALVLDRYGSMNGEPIAEAKEAAIKFAGFLGPEDRLTVVTLNHEVQTVFGPQAGGGAARFAILEIRAQGNTNLSGGWLMGQRQVRAGLVEKVRQGKSEGEGVGDWRLYLPRFRARGNFAKPADPRRRCVPGVMPPNLEIDRSRPVVLQ